MKSQDQQLLEEAYSLIIEEKLIIKELDDLLLQEDVWDTISGAVQKGKEVISGAVQSATQTASDVSQLPQKLATWSQEQVPDFLNKMADFSVNIGWQALAGAGGTYALGHLLMYLSKKMGKEADQNYDTLKTMLPTVVQDKVKEIEHLKTIDPKKYNLMVFQINKNSLLELKKQLNKNGIKTDKGILAKALDYIGKFLTSTTGTLAGAIIIPILIYKLGFNPLPAFPVIK